MASFTSNANPFSNANILVSPFFFLWNYSSWWLETVYFKNFFMSSRVVVQRPNNFVSSLYSFESFIYEFVSRSIPLSYWNFNLRRCLSSSDSMLVFKNSFSTITWSSRLGGVIIPDSFKFLSPSLSIRVKAYNSRI